MKTFFVLLFRGAGPTVLAALILLGLAEGWSRQAPAREPATIEDILISEQVRRAHELRGSIDVVILGDSSALMGIDPVELSRLFGGRVESLALFGSTGPGAYGELLDWASRECSIGTPGHDERRHVFPG
jgi:hypothetical protein